MTPPNKVVIYVTGNAVKLTPKGGGIQVIEGPPPKIKKGG